ncbi:Hypothetical predicted protein [Pelobates cultripes]|uniref:Uncharacterized protein n=1 Tax=Pelobates cultripes TaxID=61616 RepID=A0AAD1W002_PELCU|nr:Hypothetical predicted protein [Pelobates cultripes]
MQADNMADGATKPRATIPTSTPVGPKIPTVIETAQEQMDSEEFHSLLDAAMAKSVTQAIFTAMGAMSDNLSHSIATAMRSTQLPPNPMANPPETEPVAPSGRKAAKKSRHLDEYASATLQTDRARPVTEPVVGPQPRAPRRAKSVRKWKRAKALIESSDSESEQEEAQSESDNQVRDYDSVTTELATPP